MTETPLGSYKRWNTLIIRFNETSKRRGHKVIIIQFWSRMKGGLIVTPPIPSQASQSHAAAASEASQGGKMKGKKEKLKKKGKDKSKLSDRSVKQSKAYMAEQGLF